MYKKYPRGGNVSLWCDGRTVAASASTQKRKHDGEGATNRQEKEEEVESVFKQLVEKHSSKYDTPQLRLWSRMIASGIHEDYSNPPDIPAFTGNASESDHAEISCVRLSVELLWLSQMH